MLEVFWKENEMNSYGYRPLPFKRGAVSCITVRLTLKLARGKIRRTDGHNLSFEQDHGKQADILDISNLVIWD